MGVQLNIKDPTTVKLARALAERSGRSVTDTIRSALEHAIVEQDEQIAAKIKAIHDIVDEGRRNASPEVLAQTSKSALDSLYEDGLPA